VRGLGGSAAVVRDGTAAWPARAVPRPPERESRGPAADEGRAASAAAGGGAAGGGAKSTDSPASAGVGAAAADDGPAAEGVAALLVRRALLGRADDGRERGAREVALGGGNMCISPAAAMSSSLNPTARRAPALRPAAAKSRAE
jgi:hypothetical protein